MSQNVLFGKNSSISATNLSNCWNFPLFGFKLSQTYLTQFFLLWKHSSDLFLWKNPAYMPVLVWYVAFPTFQIVGIFHFLAKNYEAFLSARERKPRASSDRFLFPVIKSNFPSLSGFCPTHPHTQGAPRSEIVSIHNADAGFLRMIKNNGYPK